MDDKTDKSEPASAITSQQGDSVSCEKIQEVLFDYMSRELGDKQSWLVHEHLLHCESCRREAAVLEKTVAALRTDKSITAPEHLSNGVLRRLERALLHPVLDWIYVHRHLVAAVLAILIVGILAFLAGRYTALNQNEVHYWVNPIK